MTIDAINALDRDQFAAALGWIFEHSPWVAERAWEQRPFAGIDQLHDAMSAIVEQATREEQLALLHAHPDLGARARMSEASRSEQSGAGLDQLSAEDYQHLTRCNTAYRDKFGFPFLFAVKGSTARQIIEALERRLAAGYEEELREALSQVSRIARFRLEEHALASLR